MRWRSASAGRFETPTLSASSTPTGRRTSRSCCRRRTTRGAALAADKIRRSIASHDFSSGSWKRITVSCGAATIDAGYRPMDEAGVMNRREYTGNLLRESFRALESGRAAGTNRTSVGAYRS